MRLIRGGCYCILGCSLFLSGCLSDVWTGASLVYDRHNVYKSLSDFQLSAMVNNALFRDKVFKQLGCVVDVAIMNGDILLAGHVPSEDLRQEAVSRVKAIKGYRRLFNQLSIQNALEDGFQDDWITTKIRSQIFSDSSINPHDFKVVTVDQIVYLMGDVKPDQAKTVIEFARTCDGVKRVVKLFRYYNLSDRPNNALTPEFHSALKTDESQGDALENG